MPNKPVMEVILKHMTSPTGKINSATIVTKKAIHFIIVPTRIRKKMTTTASTSPVNKVKPVLKPFKRYEERYEYLQNPTS